MSLMDMLPCVHCGDDAHSGNMHEEMYGKPEPTPVGITGTVVIGTAVRTNEEAADYGAYSTYPVTATDAPIQILGHDENRVRALVWVDTQSVYIGKREQIYATGGAQGALLSAGQRVEIRNKQPVWMAPNGQPCNVSVINERWEVQAK